MRSPYLVVVCLLLSSCASRPKGGDEAAAPTGVDEGATVGMPGTPIDREHGEGAVVSRIEDAPALPAAPIDAVQAMAAAAVADSLLGGPESMTSGETRGSLTSGLGAVVEGGAPAIVTLGRSRGGRPIEALTLSTNAGSATTRLYLIGGVHGDECEGLTCLDGVLAALAMPTSDVMVRIVRDMNPDGSHAKSRASSSGVDLNRNWPASNFKAARSTGPSPLSEPECAAVHADLLAFDPHVIVVLHSSRRGPFVNYDGPPAAVELATTFADAAIGAGDERWRLVPDMGYPTPGSMGSYFGKDHGVPILTIELRRGDSAEQVLGPLTAGLSAVLANRLAALAPLSRATGVREIAREKKAETREAVEPAE